MPNQEYITKQRWEELHAPDKQEQQLVMQENEQQNLQQSMYEQELLSREQLHKQLLDDKRKNGNDDSVEMQQVKEWVRRVNESLEEVIAEDPERFKRQVRRLHKQYDNLSFLCTCYLAKRTPGLFGEAKRRYNLVRRIMKSADEEKERIKDFGKNMELHKDRVEGMLVGNLLANGLRDFSAQEEVNLHDFELNYENTKYQNDSYSEDGTKAIRREMSARPKQKDENVRRAVTASRLARYMGIENEVQQADLLVAKTGRREYHYGMKYTEILQGEKTLEEFELEQQNAQVNEMNPKPYKVVYPPEVKKQLSRIRLFNLLLGRRNVSIDRTVKMTFSQVNDPGNILDEKVFYVTSVRLNAEINGGFADADMSKIDGDLRSINAISGGLDKGFCETIWQMSEDDIQYVAGDLLNKTQLKTIRARFTHIRNRLVPIIRNTHAPGEEVLPLNLRREKQWSAPDTVSFEEMQQRTNEAHQQKLAEEQRRREEEARRAEEEKRRIEEEKKRREEEEEKARQEEEKKKQEELDSKIKAIEDMLVEAEKPAIEKEKTEEEKKAEEAKLIERALKEGEDLSAEDNKREKVLDKLDNDKMLQDQLKRAEDEANISFRYDQVVNAFKGKALEKWMKERVPKYGEYLMNTVVDVFAKLSEARKLYAVWIEQKQTTNWVYEKRIELLEKDLDYVKKVLFGWTSDQERATVTSPDFKTIPVVARLNNILENLNKGEREDANYLEYKKSLVGDVVKEKKKEIEDLYKDIPFVEETAQDEETKQLFNELIEIIKKHPITPNKPGAWYATRYRIVAYNNILKESEDLLAKLDVEKLTAGQFQMLRELNLMTAHRLYVKFLTSGDHSEKQQEKTPLPTGQVSEKVNYASTDEQKEKYQLRIIGTDRKKDKDGNEVTEYKVEWSKEGDEHPQVFLTKRDPREMAMYQSDQKSIRQGSNAYGYRGTCSMGSSAQCINQVLGHKVTNENINLDLMAKMFPEYYSSDRALTWAPERDRYGNIIKESGKKLQPRNSGHAEDWLLVTLPWAFGIQTIVPKEDKSKRPDINADKELDKNTGLDVYISAIEQKLNQGGSVQVAISSDIFRDTPINEKFFYKTKEPGEQARRIWADHYICLCGTCYDPKDGHLAGFFYKDTGWNDVQFVSTEKLTKATRGIRNKEHPEESIGINTMMLFAYMPPAKDAEKNAQVDPTKTESKEEKTGEKKEEKVEEKKEEKVEEKKEEKVEEKKEEKVEEKKEEKVEEKKEEKVEEKKELEMLEIPKGVNSSLKMGGMDQVYVKQYDQDCYCVAGVTLLNQFKAKQKKLPEIIRNMPHSAMRSFHPDFKVYDEKCNEMNEEADFIFWKEIDAIKSYTAPGSEQPGNIYKLADFYLKFLKDSPKDVVVRNMRFGMPTERDTSKDAPTKTNNRKAIFIGKVKEIIDGGGIAAMMHSFGGKAHYTTITAINDQEVTLYDSLDYDPKQGAKHVPLTEILKPGAGIELTWLTEMPDKTEDLTKEFKNLSYDDEKGFSLKKPTADLFTEPAHTQGIDVSILPEDLPEGYDDGIEIRAYFRNEKAKVDSVKYNDV